MIALLVIGAILSPFLWFGAKEWQTHRNLEKSFSTIRIPTNYKITGSECSNEEMRPFCEYRYYSSEPIEQSTAKIIKLLSDVGFDMSYREGGLSGPNQQAYTGNNSTSNTYLTYYEIERGKNIQYEQEFGNVHFRIYPTN